LSGEIIKAAEMHLRKSRMESAQRDVAKGIAMGAQGSLPTSGARPASSSAQEKTLRDKILAAYNK
jgi:hypothetical protein